MPLCRRLRVSSARMSLVPVCSAAAGVAAGSCGRVRLRGRGPGHPTDSLSLVMSAIRLSWVASRTGTSPVIRPADSV